MAAVDLCDRVTVEPADTLSVETVPAADVPMQKNTAYRAAVAMGERYGREPRVHIGIEKHIPLCAGLGGTPTNATPTTTTPSKPFGL